MSAAPDTPAWRELLRLAAGDGLEEVALRHSRRAASWFADLTWRGGERESVRLHGSGDPDELALALARELGLPLGSVQRDRLP